jgi:hypothetical protein
MSKLNRALIGSVGKTLANTKTNLMTLAVIATCAPGGIISVSSSSPPPATVMVKAVFDRLLAITVPLGNTDVTSFPFESVFDDVTSKGVAL